MNLHLLFLLLFISYQSLAQSSSYSDTVSYVLSGETIRFFIRGQADSSTALYINLHDNENTCVAATDSIIAQYGGRFIELRFKGNRWVGGWLNPNRHFWFDPNRIYTQAGIDATLRAYRSYSPYSQIEVRNFAAFITDSLLANASIIVAVHNNQNGYNIEKYMPDSIFAADAARLYINPEQSPHDFFYVLDSSFFDFFSQNGYNVVQQSDSTYLNDGSLSVYCALKGIPYINVEALEGHLSQQIEMLEQVQQLLQNRHLYKKTKRDKNYKSILRRLAGC